MPKITIVDHLGTARTIEAASGASLMEAGVKAGVPDLVAECGGARACATCHVYIEDEFFGKVGPADEPERQMLEYAESPVKATSRLSCQITISDELEGMTVHTPPAQ
jgi:2Fe-2S ferredoxin